MPPLKLSELLSVIVGKSPYVFPISLNKEPCLARKRARIWNLRCLFSGAVRAKENRYTRSIKSRISRSHKLEVSPRLPNRSARVTHAAVRSGRRHSPLAGLAEHLCKSVENIFQHKQPQSLLSTDGITQNVARHYCQSDATTDPPALSHRSRLGEPAASPAPRIDDVWRASIGAGVAGWFVTAITDDAHLSRPSLPATSSAIFVNN